MRYDLYKFGLIIYDLTMQNKENTIDLLVKQGFMKPPFFKIGKNIDDVISTTQDQNIKKFLDEQDIEFDGLVIKVADPHIRTLIWSTNHHPKWAIAYKYPAKQVTTQIVSIDMQVWRTGIITPVANLAPVNIDWVTVSRVSLHNFDFIKEKDIHLHDHVVIQRSGEVIPYIVATIPSLRDGTQEVINPPALCPVCHAHITIVEDKTIMYYCINASCPASRIEKIKHFVSRDCMDIGWLGESIITVLLEADIISDYTDIYKLLDPQVQMIVKNLPNMGIKKVENITSQLHKSKSNELYRIINAIGIPQVGIKTSKIIVDHIYQDMHDKDINISWYDADRLIWYLQDDGFLSKIHSIWSQTIQSIKDRLDEEHNIWLIKKLSDHGVKFDNFGLRETSLQSQKLGYMRFAISGRFEIPRETIAQKLVLHGAQYMPNITKNTNLLIIWEDPSSKVSKADKLGIQTVYGLDELSKITGIDIHEETQQANVWLFGLW